MTESGWLACSFCGLKHQRRPDGRCPRCGNLAAAPPFAGRRRLLPAGVIRSRTGAITADERTWGMLRPPGLLHGRPILPIVALFHPRQAVAVRSRPPRRALDNYITSVVVVSGDLLMSAAVIALAAAGMAASAKTGQPGLRPDGSAWVWACSSACSASRSSSP